MAIKITFVKTGTNSEGAVTGDLKLLDGSTVVKQSVAFTGRGALGSLQVSSA